MLIDGIDSANLFPLVQLPDRLPAKPSGKAVAFSTVWRWVRFGQRGVKLKAVRIGQSLYTSDAWVSDFIAAIGTEPGKLDRSSVAPDRPVVASPSRSRRVAEANAALDALGV